MSAAEPRLPLVYPSHQDLSVSSKYFSSAVILESDTNISQLE